MDIIIPYKNRIFIKIWWAIGASVNSQTDRLLPPIVHIWYCPVWPDRLDDEEM